jgi:hypothetical protein
LGDPSLNNDGSFYRRQSKISTPMPSLFDWANKLGIKAQLAPKKGSRLENLLPFFGAQLFQFAGSIVF